MEYAKLAIIALSLALDVFAVSVGVGLRGVDPKTKLRMGCAFALAEVLMNLAGAGIGALAGSLLGQAAGYLGFGALVAIGAYMLYEARLASDRRKPLDLSTGWGLTVAALAISLDSLGIGFSILFIGVPLAAALLAVGLTSVVATFSGLTLGRRLGIAAEEAAGLWAGVILMLTGILFAAQKYFAL